MPVDQGYLIDGNQQAFRASCWRNISPTIRVISLQFSLLVGFSVKGGLGRAFVLRSNNVAASNKLTPSDRIFPYLGRA
jgi:hypothetical protein